MLNLNQKAKGINTVKMLVAKEIGKKMLATMACKAGKSYKRYWWSSKSYRKP